MALAALVPAAVSIVSKIIDKTVEDPQEAAKQKASLLQMHNEHELKLLEQQMSAIIAEAQSKDPYTSRARPTFLYVFYIMILASIPMGIGFSFEPERTLEIVQGMQAWFNALPEALYWVFGTGFLGYTGARSFDKKKLAEMWKK